MQTYLSMARDASRGNAEIFIELEASVFPKSQIVVFEPLLDMVLALVSSFGHCNYTVIQ